MIDIYFIGGSPCSGKSTVANVMSEKYDMYYFKVDDFLEKYTRLGKLKDYEICKKQYEMSPDSIWLREPQVQCNEEFIFYEEISNFILYDLKQINGCRAVIAEGVAFLPELMKKLKVANNKYVAIIPTKDFQISYYRKREWIHHVLDGCSDKKNAFDNWMERDALFAQTVKSQCYKEGYLSIINDGTLSIDSITNKVCKHFGLEA